MLHRIVKITNMSNKKLQIRNSTAEFLIFTNQAQEQGIEVLVKDETVWLSQKLIAILFDIDRSVITKHLKNIFEIVRNTTQNTII